MKILVDTNILARSVEPGHVLHPQAKDAVSLLLRQGHDLCLVPQVIYEFWGVCTRPTAVNGLGKTVAETVTELANFRAVLTLHDDHPQIFVEWERLVTSFAVLGKNAHDASLVSISGINVVSRASYQSDQSRY